MRGEHDLIDGGGSPITTIIAAPQDRTLVLSDPVPAPRALADLLAELIGDSQSPNTQKAYATDLTDFFTYLLGPQANITVPVSRVASEHHEALQTWAGPLLHRLTQVYKNDITGYIAHLSAGPDKDGLAAATIKRRLTPLRLLFKLLHEYGLITFNPAAGVRAPRVSRRSTTIYLTRQQARHLEDVCGGTTLRDLRDLALIRLMIRTGLRSTEVCKLQLNEIGQLDGHTVAWIIGKGGERERIKIPPVALRAMRAYLDAAGITDGVVFRRLRRASDLPSGYTVDPGTLSYGGLKFILKERFTQAGLRAIIGDDDRDDFESQSDTDADQRSGPRRRNGPTPHSLRHTFVTLALKGGASIPEVQAAARHRDPNTTMRYAHDMDNLDRNAVDKVDY